MEYLLNFDDILLLIGNILKKTDAHIFNDGIFKLIEEEHDILKNKYELLIKSNDERDIENKKISDENIILSNELKELKLYTSSLEECIHPNDKTINYLTMEVQNLKFKKDELKKLINSLRKQNKILKDEKSDIINKHKNFYEIIKNKYAEELQKEKIQIKSMNFIINDAKSKYDDIISLKNKLLDENELLKLEKTNIINSHGEEINKYSNDIKNYLEEINFLNNSSTEQNKIIEALEKKNNKENIINAELIKQISTIGNDNKIIIDGLNKKLSTMHNDNKIIIDALTKERDILNSELLKIKNTHAGEIKNLEEKNNILDKENKNLETKINTLAQEIKKLKEIKKNTLIVDMSDNEIILNADNIGEWENKTINKRTHLKNKLFFEKELKAINKDIGIEEMKENKFTLRIEPANNELINTVINEPVLIGGGNLINGVVNEPVLNGGAHQPKKIYSMNKKMDINIIDNVKKLIIGEEPTTLTDQDIDINDKKKIHLLYNKKTKRYNRRLKINLINE